MSVAFSMMSRLHQSLLLTFSPSYRRIRERLAEISRMEP